MLIAAGFQEVYFCYSIVAYYSDVCQSVAWIQNMSVIALNSFRSHSISMLTKECSSYGGCLYIYIYGLCGDTVSRSYHKVWTCRMISEYLQKGCERKQLWSNI